MAGEILDLATMGFNDIAGSHVPHICLPEGSSAAKDHHDWQSNTNFCWLLPGTPKPLLATAPALEEASGPQAAIKFPVLSKLQERVSLLWTFRVGPFLQLLSTDLFVCSWSRRLPADSHKAAPSGAGPYYKVEPLEGASCRCESRPCCGPRVNKIEESFEGRNSLSSPATSRRPFADRFRPAFASGFGRIQAACSLYLGYCNVPS